MSPTDNVPSDLTLGPDLETEVKKPVKVSIDSDLADYLKGLALQQGLTTSEMANKLFGFAIDEQKKMQEKRVTITVRVKKSHESYLKNLAEMSGVSLNTITASAIEQAIEMRLDDAQKAAIKLMHEQLQETLQTAIAAQMAEIKAQAHRHAHLLSRTILENIQNRQLMFSLLQAQGISDEDIVALSEQALRYSVSQLKGPKPMMRDAIKDFIGVSLVVDEDVSQGEEEDAESYIQRLEERLYELEDADGNLLHFFEFADQERDLPEYEYKQYQRNVILGKIAAVKLRLFELGYFVKVSDKTIHDAWANE